MPGSFDKSHLAVTVRFARSHTRTVVPHLQGGWTRRRGTDGTAAHESAQGWVGHKGRFMGGGAHPPQGDLALRAGRHAPFPLLAQHPFPPWYPPVRPEPRAARPPACASSGLTRAHLKSLLGCHTEEART